MYKSVKEYSVPDNHCIDTIEIGAEANIYSPIKAYAQTNSYPIICGKSIIGKGHINIKRDYYYQHQTECNELIEKIIRETKEESIGFLNYDIITEEVIEAILSNNNIKRVGLPGIRELNKSVINKNFIKVMSTMSSAYSTREISNYGKLKVSSKMSKEEFAKLKILLTIYKVKEVIIEGSAVEQLDEVLPLVATAKITIDDNTLYLSHWELQREDVKEFIDDSSKTNAPFFEVSNLFSKGNYDWLRSCECYSKTIKNIEKKYSEVIKKYPNISFAFNDAGDTVEGINIINKNRIYNAIIAETKRLELSPLETYIYLYDIVKFFKKYKGEPKKEIPELSRKSEFILFGEYIVCAGYTRIIAELVELINNPKLTAIEYVCRETEESRHARLIVAMDDRKYNVKGMYSSDPTFDSVQNVEDPLSIDKYDHCLLTKSQIDKVDTDIKDYCLQDCTDVLFRGMRHFNPKRCPMYAWNQATYIEWKTGKILYDERFQATGAPYILSDPLEIKQEKIPMETILKARERIFQQIKRNKSQSRVLSFINKYREIFYDAEEYIKHVGARLNAATYIRQSSFTGQTQKR